MAESSVLSKIKKVCSTLAWVLYIIAQIFYIFDHYDVISLPYWFAVSMAFVLILWGCNDLLGGCIELSKLDGKLGILKTILGVVSIAFGIYFVLNVLAIIPFGIFDLERVLYFKCLIWLSLFYLAA